MTDYILSPEGRLVGGHPMNARSVTDDQGAPKLNKFGEARSSTYIGLAIPKGLETDWRDTQWGQQIVNAAKRDYPGNEWQAPNFSWKITDGDSGTPNEAGTIPSGKEGYPGHWVMNLSTELVVKCYHAGKYGITDNIRDSGAIKPGDYCRVQFSAEWNGNVNNPRRKSGMYLNPWLFELSRAGEAIVLSDGPSAAQAFGGEQTPSVTAPPPPGAQHVTPPPTPARVMLPGANGATYEQLVAAGWTDDLLVQNGMMQG